MKTILAVDDSPSMRDMLEFTIRSAGFEFVSACDGMDALDKMKQSPVDLVVSDLNMPKLDGIGLVKSIREIDKYRKTPVLLLTTETGAQMKDAARAAGASGWLVKPFDPPTLVSLIQRLA